MVAAAETGGSRTFDGLELEGSIGLAHDYLLVMRGAERTFAAIAEMAPGAPIYTLLYDRDGTGGRFDRHAVVTSGLQRLGVKQRGFRALLPLLPGAAGRLPADGHELVTASGPPRTPSTSATATRRFGTRGSSASEPSGRCPGGCGRCSM